MVIALTSRCRGSFSLWSRRVDPMADTHDDYTEPHHGLCLCGCGQRTTIAPCSDKSKGLVKGQPIRFVNGHNSRRKHLAGPYRNVTVKGRRAQSIHRFRAEQALGHPLPVGAEVHHADGSTRDDAPLVICQDSSYHKLLHTRMRVLRAGGNPNTDRLCSQCKQPFPIAMYQPSLQRAANWICANCYSSLQHKYYLRRVAKVAVNG